MTVEAEQQKRPQAETPSARSNGALQRAAVNEPPVTDVPPIVREVLRSPGQPLSVETRAFFEARFGHDFSGVRVHTDAQAAESAQAVNALAYTVGHNVVFGSGQYQPEAPAGEELLAHELTHVVQPPTQAPGAQNFVLRQAAPAPPSPTPAISGPASNAGELDAVANSLLKMQKGAAINPTEWQGLARQARFFAQISATLSLTGNSAASPSTSEAADTSILSLEQRLAIIAFPDIFGKYIVDQAITFETITEDQRAVFKALPPAPREKVRIASLRKSKLFRAISILQSEPGRYWSAAGPQAQASGYTEQNIANYRLNPAQRPSGDIVPSSLANEVALTTSPGAPTGKPVGIVAEVLVERYLTYPDKPIAKYVAETLRRKHNNVLAAQKQLEQETHGLACGILSLFVMAISRQPWMGDKFGAAELKQWLVQSIFETVPPLIAVVETTVTPPQTPPGAAPESEPPARPAKVKRLRMADTSGVLKALTRGGQLPTQSTAFPGGKIELNERGSAQKFQTAMKAPKVEKQDTVRVQNADIRLALLSVRGDAPHMHVAYLDMDGEWRTLDTYLSLGDQPLGGMPYAASYEQVFTSFRLVLDSIK